MSGHVLPRFPPGPHGRITPSAYTFFFYFSQQNLPDRTCPMRLVCSALQPLRSPQAQRSPQTQRSPQPQRSRLLLQAAAQPAAGGEAGGSGGGRRLRREQVDFVVSGNGAMPFAHVSQGDLDNILTVYGACGFVTANGRISRMLEDLPEGGTVKLVLPEDPPLTTQACPGAACNRCPACKGGVARLVHECTGCRWFGALQLCCNSLHT